MTPTLPFELYDAIITHVSSGRDLCATALASHTLQRIAEPHLYHTIKLTSRPAIERVCTQIISTPRTHRLIHDLDLRDDISGKPDSVESDPDRGWYLFGIAPWSFWDRVSRALVCLDNLDTLYISSHASDCPHAWLLPVSPRFSLTKFTSTFPIDISLICFLKEQTEIRYLALYHPHSKGFKPGICRQLPAFSLPKLDALRTPSQPLVCQLLPGRSISQLNILPKGSKVLWDSLAGSKIMGTTYVEGGCLKSLRAAVRCEEIEESVQMMIKYFPNIEELGLVQGVNEDNVHTLRPLSRLRHLRALYMRDSDCKTIISSLAQDIPSLRIVSYQERVGPRASYFTFLPINPVSSPWKSLYTMNTMKRDRLWPDIMDKASQKRRSKKRS